MKTAEQVLAGHSLGRLIELQHTTQSGVKYQPSDDFIHKDACLEAMKDYARQVAEAVKQRCYNEINTGNRVRIKDLDITHFIQ